MVAATDPGLPAPTSTFSLLGPELGLLLGLGFRISGLGFGFRGFGVEGFRVVATEGFRVQRMSATGL